MKIKKKRKQNVLIDSYVKVSHRGDFTELHRCYLHFTISPQVWQHTHLNVRIGEWWNFFSRKNQYQNTKLIVKNGQSEEETKPIPQRKRKCLNWVCAKCINMICLFHWFLLVMNIVCFVSYTNVFSFNRSLQWLLLKCFIPFTHQFLSWFLT